MPARIEPGQIGRIDWDYDRSPGQVRGVARTRDGAGKPRRVVATRGSAAEVEVESRRQAAALVYAGDLWSESTSLSEAIERWLATLGDGEEQDQKVQTVETYARVACGVIVPRLGALPIGEPTTPRLQRCMDDMRTEPHRGKGAAKVGYSDHEPGRGDLESRLAVGHG